MKVRSWYSLTGEIEVENELWHLVKIGNITLNHPPLVNLILRRGLPHSDRLRLSYLHEFGHFQTLPLALTHVLFVAWSARRQHLSFLGWLSWLAGLIIAHEAVWELLSEAYVVLQERAAYHKAYRQAPNPLLPVFWAGMSGLGISLSLLLVRKDASPNGRVRQVTGRPRLCCDAFPHVCIHCDKTRAIMRQILSYRNNGK